MVGLHRHEYDALVQLQLPSIIKMCKKNAQALWAPAQNLQIITFPVHDEAHEDPALHTQREGKLEDLTQHEEPEDKREIHACVRVSRIIVAKEKVDDVFLAVCNLHWLLQDMVGKQAIHEAIEQAESREVLS